VRVMLSRGLRALPARRSRIRPLAVVAAFATAAAIVAPVALAAKKHAFTASYAGHGSGAVIGRAAAGSATATGRGRVIGAGTLTGSASGVFTSQTCVVFSGTAVLKGSPGSVTLAAHDAQACAGSTDANSVSFSGSAKVTGGTSTFAGAHGTLAFTGTYLRGRNRRQEFCCVEAATTRRDSAIPLPLVATRCGRNSMVRRGLRFESGRRFLKSPLRRVFCCPEWHSGAPPS
jgi:hypothetical protein